MTDAEKKALEERLAKFKASEPQQKMSIFADKFKIKDNKELYKKKYPTGFNGLDRLLFGGLTSGLHCIGAISSLGKSTFVMQIADNMANNDIPVIIFSLEMKAIDLTAKAISRQTYVDTRDEDERLAKSSDMLLTEKIAKNFTDQEWNVISKAASTIEERGKNITVVECGSTTYDVEKIGLYVQTYVQAYDVKPVVVIDYLQILDAPDKLKSATDKQVTDYNIKRLKVLADYFDLPVVLISSFNRDNYDTKANLKAFKDTGNIEYSCDTLIGLQLAGMEDSTFDSDKAMASFPRKIELTLLKQRYGPARKVVPFNFYPRYNFFEEDEGTFVDAKDTDIPFFEDAPEPEPKQGVLKF